MPRDYTRAVREQRQALKDRIEGFRTRLRDAEFLLTELATGALKTAQSTSSSIS